METLGLEGLLTQYISNSINNIFTAMPAQVVRVVSLGEQRVDVRPLVNRVKPDDMDSEHPVILSVPLVFPGSSTSQFSFPVGEGDTVLCVFSQRSIQRFKMGGTEPHRPIDLSKYSRNDAVAIPGLYSFGNAPNNPGNRSLGHSVDDAVISHNIGSGSECEVRLSSDGSIIINAPSNMVNVNCKSSTVTAEEEVVIDTPEATVKGNLLVEGLLTYTGGMAGSNQTGSGQAAMIQGSLEATDEVTASGVNLSSHVHTNVESGPDDTGEPKK